MRILSQYRGSAIGILVFMMLVCLSCNPSLAIQAKGADGANVTFETGFSPLLEKTFKSMMQSVSGENASPSTQDTALFSRENVISLMKAAGLMDVTASRPNSGRVTAKGSIGGISQSTLTKAGILFRTQNTLSLVMGPKQFQSLYAMLDEESQAYFDLMMIPSLNDDTMTIPQYEELLSSVYGQKFAEEITKGKLFITLSSPDGKKKSDFQLTLGEILTLADEKKWTVQW